MSSFYQLRHWNPRFLELLLAAAWLIVVGIGLIHFQHYNATAGGFGQVEDAWPDNSRLRHPGSGKTLLMFAHPRCPCTRASLKELALALADIDCDIKATVVFFRPDGADAGWTDTDLVCRAAEIKGLKIIWDDGGRLADLYRVETSGHVLVFDQDGALLFSGGITSMRGHEGSNGGFDALVHSLTDSSARAGDSPVFGCPLGTPKRESLSP